MVILDLSLPDGAGWDLLPQIRAQQPAARVVFLSAAEMSQEVATQVEAVLLKSQVSPSGLLKALSARRALSKDGNPSC